MSACRIGEKEILENVNLSASRSPGDFGHNTAGREVKKVSVVTYYEEIVPLEDALSCVENHWGQTKYD
jgi:hypothetical protein